MDEYHVVKFFETDNNDSRLSSMYPSFALSDFHLQCRLKSLSETPLNAASEAPPDRKLCSPYFLQSRFTAFRTLIKFSRILLYEIGLFFVRKLNFLPLLKPLKMKSSEFSDIFEGATQYLSCFHGQILLEVEM